MNLRATLVATMRAPALLGREADLGEHADWVEWRADLLGDGAPEDFGRTGVQRLYSLRSTLEGGQGPDNRAIRVARLVAAERDFDFIELEGQRDLIPPLLAAIPPQRRIISWHGPAADGAMLRDMFASFQQVEACLYRFVTMDGEVAGALEGIEFLAATGRQDVIAYSENADATWTRPLAARYGAPIVFGDAAGDRADSSTELSALVLDYGLPELHPVTELFAIVGKPVSASPSPGLHNAAYRACGAARLFVRFPVQSFPSFWQQVMKKDRFDALGIRVCGVTVASPHKKAALSAATKISSLSRKAESANVMFRRGVDWHADTTDAAGVLMNLESARIACEHRRVAVIGCGGSGRPIAAALHREGAYVTLVNRSLARGHFASELLDLPFVALADFMAGEFDIVINATPVGKRGEDLPIDLTPMPQGLAVVDLVFSRSPTPLCTRARAHGHTVIDGRDILLAQAARQYHLMTGEEMPRASIGDFLRADAHRRPAGFPLGTKPVALFPAHEILVT